MKKFIGFLILALTLTVMPKNSSAATLAEVNACEYGLNLASPGQMQKCLLGSKIQKGRVHSMKGTWNFAVDGGSSAAAIGLKGPNGKALTLPNKAIVRDCIIDVITAPTSAGSATIAIGTGQAANDLKVAAAYSGFSALMACVPVGTAATAIKLTADRSPTLTIATAPLTAGKINVIIDYEISE